MGLSSEARPSLVPRSATQDGDVRGRWPSALPAVWTERMLTTLEEGVKGGVWFSLMDKVFAERTLRAAADSVIANEGAPGVDRVGVEEFQADLFSNVKKLSAALRDGSYEPNAIRRVFIPKPGSNEQRPLGIPTVRDRTVQSALRYVLEPIFEKEFAERSYGFRPGRGCKDGLRRVVELLDGGFCYVVDADLKSFFDTIRHDSARSPDGSFAGTDRGRACVGSDRIVSEGRDFGRTDGNGTRGGGTARRGFESVVEQHLFEPAGPSDGEAGDRDGALRGRLRDFMPQRAGGGAGTGNGTSVVRSGRVDAASGQDENRGLANRGLRLFGLSFRDMQRPPNALAAKEEPGQVEGCGSCEDEANERQELASDSRRVEPDVDRLVRILPTQ